MAACGVMTSPLLFFNSIMEYDILLNDLMAYEGFLCIKKKKGALCNRRRHHKFGDQIDLR